MCIFCKVDKNLVLLESKHSTVLANYFPLGKYSLLAIPKSHKDSITQLTAEELSDLIEIIALAVNNIKSVVNPEGIIVFLNKGEIAGQTIPHLHFHIVARENSDGLENFKRNGEKEAISEEDLRTLKNLF